MERMMTGDGRVRTFAECRNRRNRRTLLRVSVVLGVLLAAILALLFCLGRFAGRGPFAPGAAQAKYSPSSWSLIVVNRWNRIPDDYPAPKLIRLSNGESVDSRIYPDLQRMFDDMRAAGLHPEVTSAYRTEAVQRQLLDEKIFLYQNEGASKEEARRQASQWVAEPGTSEHELGLAGGHQRERGHRHQGQRQRAPVACRQRVAVRIHPALSAREDRRDRHRV